MTFTFMVYIFGFLTLYRFVSYFRLLVCSEMLSTTSVEVVDVVDGELFDDKTVAWRRMC